MFTIRQHETLTLKAWFSLRDSIEFDPSYQRKDNIWPLRDQAYLIDTIVNSFDIPKLYMADFRSINAPLNTGNKMYAVVDGKQRLAAIVKFFNGELTLGKDFIYANDRSVKLAGLSYQDLTWQFPWVVQQIDDYKLTVMSVVTDDPNDTRIKEIFIRLNRGVSLSGAEKRNAMPGPAPTVIRSLAGHRFFVKNVRFDTLRGQDKNAAAKLLLIEYRQSLWGTKKQDLDKFVLEAEEATTVPTVYTSLFSESITKDFEDAYSRGQQNLDVMSEVFTTTDPILSSAGALPLYYWFVRNHAAENKQFLRSFLIGFEKSRLSNRKALNSGAENIDDKLVRYDIYNRSPDDVGSLEVRYNILSSRLSEFVQNIRDNPEDLILLADGEIEIKSPLFRR